VSVENPTNFVASNERQSEKEMPGIEYLRSGMAQVARIVHNYHGQFETRSIKI
jgi:hypothetical protein